MFKGLGNLGNLANLMKQAGKVREEMQRISESLRAKSVEGTAGGGMVTVKVNGKQEVLSCQIDAQIFADGDRELLEDLLAAATNQALEKSRKLAAEEMSRAASGLSIPGLSDALCELGLGQS